MLESSERRFLAILLIWDPRALEAARAHPPGSPPYCSAHRFNFSLSWSTIRSVRHNPKKKWGMASVPHEGRLEFELENGVREFIILGRDRASGVLAALRDCPVVVTA